MFIIISEPCRFGGTRLHGCFPCTERNDTMPSLTTYKLLKQEHDARRGEFKTVHGTVQTLSLIHI